MSSKNQEIDMEDMQRFLPYDPNAVTYSDPKKNGEKKLSSEAAAFNGLTKEQIMAYASDPKWVRIRWVLFGAFWTIWILMLVAAVLIVVYTPKCAHRPKLNFWDKEVVYQVDVANFKDQNNDLKGDLAGLVAELDYFDKLGVKTLLLNDQIVRQEGSEQVFNSDFGSSDDLKKLRTKMNEKDMHLVVDISMDVLEKDKVALKF
jgi:hypothetical protein